MMSSRASSKVTLADVLNERALRVRNRFEAPVLIAALLVVPVIFIEERASSGALLAAAAWANWLIWLVFAMEYFTVLWLADRRWAYTRLAWLDLIDRGRFLPTLADASGVDPAPPGVSS